MHPRVASAPPPLFPRDAFDGKGPPRRPQKRVERRLEEVAKAVGSGYCRLQMPLKLALAVRETVAGRWPGALAGRPRQRVEEQSTWAAQKHSEAGYGRPVDRGVWTAKTVKRPRQQPAHPQYANYWAPLTRKRHTMPHSAQSQHANYWALRTRKRHQQEHRPQWPTESSDPTQHAKGRTGDRPGPRKGATTRRNVTQGGTSPPFQCIPPPPHPPRSSSLHSSARSGHFLSSQSVPQRLLTSHPPPSDLARLALLRLRSLRGCGGIMLTAQGIICISSLRQRLKWRSLPARFWTTLSGLSVTSVPLGGLDTAFECRVSPLTLAQHLCFGRPVVCDVMGRTVGRPCLRDPNHQRWSTHPHPHAIRRSGRRSARRMIDLVRANRPLQVNREHTRTRLCRLVVSGVSGQR